MMNVWIPDVSEQGRSVQPEFWFSDSADEVEVGAADDDGTGTISVNNAGRRSDDCCT